MRLQILVTAAVFSIFVAASFIGTYQLSKKHRAVIDDQASRLEYFEKELDRARDALNLRKRSPRPKSRNNVFGGADLDNLHLKGVTIRSDTAAFQQATFREANLEGATLTAGVSSFQYASFDQASLANAALTGGGASFQFASFNEADLTGASLKGNFQIASFENADLTGATWIGSFQQCNISGARFAGANLLEVQAGNLESCYFKDAPTYNSETRFPKDFDPERNGWKRIAE